jgi:hypothetical protein
MSVRTELDQLIAAEEQAVADLLGAKRSGPPEAVAKHKTRIDSIRAANELVKTTGSPLEDVASQAVADLLGARRSGPPEAVALHRTRIDQIDTARGAVRRMFVRTRPAGRAA